MRDDGVALITYPTTTNLTYELSLLPFNASMVESSGLFPLPQGPNATLDVFNVTVRATTDAQFRCLNEANAYAAAKSGTFPRLYFYEFQRSYQPKDYSPNAPVSPG
jgi:hypothetical protein